MYTLNEIIEKYGIEKLNSLTKYPSIMTYHELGEKGCLKPTLTEGKAFINPTPIYVTEKIDGTNSRVIMLGKDYIIGSREEFLYAKGDRLYNHTLNIVNLLRGPADIISEVNTNSECIYVLYGETYGGNVTANSKQYTTDKSYGFRVFDYITIPLADIETVLSMPIENISSWREHGGQHFANVKNIISLVNSINFFLEEKYPKCETVPFLQAFPGNIMPTTLKETYEWMKKFANTNAGINNHGISEGVVIRTADRSLIRKLRFEDYEKTKKRNIF